MVLPYDLILNIEFPIRLLPKKYTHVMTCSFTHILKTLGLPGQIQGSCAHIDIQVMFGKRATMFFQIVPGILIQVRILVETEHSINLYLIR